MVAEPLAPTVAFPTVLPPTMIETSAEIALVFFMVIDHELATERQVSMAGKRRDNGLGCTTRLANGTYRGYFTLDDGRRKWVSGKTEREVKAKLADLRRENERGHLRFTEKQTFVQYWLETVVRPHRKVRTYTSYEQLLRVHVLPTLGHLQIAKVSP